MATYHGEMWFFGTLFYIQIFHDLPATQGPGLSCETTLRSGTELGSAGIGHVSKRNLALCILFASPPVESHICGFGVANSVEPVLGAYRCFKHGEVESFGHPQSLQDASKLVKAWILALLKKTSVHGRQKCV